MNIISSRDDEQKLARCSVNGLAHCGRATASGSRARTLFWATVTVAFVCMTTYQLSMIAADYWRYPVLTVVDVTTRTDGAEFPTVIMCSHNPVPCRNLFPVSLRFPELWEASGCSAGVQIEPYVADVIEAFGSDRNGSGMPAKFMLHDSGDNKVPIVTLWAHYDVYPPSVRRMLQDPDLLAVLRAIEEFMRSDWISKKSSKEVLQLQHNISLKHLQNAEIIASFAKTELPILNEGSKQAKANNVTENISEALAKFYLQLATLENVSKQLLVDWIDAIAHGADFTESATLLGIRLNAGFGKFVAEKVMKPLRDFPGLWTLFDRPQDVANSLKLVSENMKRISSVANATQMFVPSAREVFRNLSKYEEIFNNHQNVKNDLSRFQAVGQSGLSQRSDRFKSFFLSLPAQIQNELMVDEDEILLACQFAGEPCEKLGLTSMMSTTYGKCVIFNDDNGNGDSAEPVKTNTLGEDGGLSVLLRIAEDTEYARRSVRSSGARITILPFNSPPNVIEDGFDIPISFETNLELTAKTIKRLPAPYHSDCQMHWNRTFYSFKNHNYDYKACLRFCLGHEIFDTCKCVDPRSKANHVEYKGHHFDGPWCNYSTPDSEDSVCVRQVKRQKRGMQNKFPCPCRPACEINSYHIQTSSTLISSPGASQTDICRTAEENNHLGFGGDHKWTPKPCSLVKVNVFFASFDVTETREEAKYSNFSVASDIGGALSLLLGLCGITVLETVVIICDSLVKLYKKRTEKRDKSNRKVTGIDHS